MQQKRVLIISYYWPPSGGIGVLRNLKFVKYLRDFGWEPILYIPKNPQYPYLDNSNDKDIPENLTILSTPIIEPHGIFKMLTGKKKNEPMNNPVAIKSNKLSLIDKIGIYIRGNFFIPDARFLWIQPSIKFLNSYLKTNHIDIIFTDGPPHSNTRIGTLLKKETNIPWLADFQDPWSQVDYLQKFKLSKAAWKKHKRMEQDAFFYADKITSASPRSGLDLEKIGAKNVSTLYYGFDEDDFKNIIPCLDKKFSIVHAGLLGDDRNPVLLFEALNELIKEMPSLKNDLEIKLIGETDIEVLNSIEKNNLKSTLKYLGTIRREETLIEICNSQILMLCINKADNAPGRIPAKIFEYLRAKRPIVAFGPAHSDIADILKNTTAGQLFEYHQNNELKNQLKIWYQLYLENNLTCNSKNIEDYNVKNITKELALHFNEIILKS